MEYRLKKYDSAMNHLKLIDEKYFYSKALVMQRKKILTTAIPICGVGILCLVVVLVVLKIAKKKRKTKLKKI